MVGMRILLGAGLAVGSATSSVQAEVRIGAAAPFTGTMAWFGEQHERGAAMAVAELDQAGGLLGESIELSVADDYCEAGQAVAAARQLIADGVVATSRSRAPG